MTENRDQQDSEESTKKEMRLVWWEKSVEWQFIALAVKDRPLALMAALDGDPEQALGDAIFGEGSKYVLIEFKKDHDALSSEKKKYADKNASTDAIKAAYEAAKAALENQKAAGAHVLIYGESAEYPPGSKQSQCPELSRFLKLVAAPYWDPKPLKEDVLTWCTTEGVKHDDFDPYLAELAARRVSEGTSGSRSLVVAVSGSGKGTFTLDVHHYKYLRATPAHVLKCDPAPEVTSTVTRKHSF